MELTVSGSYTVLFDEADLGLVSGYRWYVVPGRSTHYAVTQVRRKTIYMHRLIMGSPSGLSIDHVNRDGLDNRRANLRLATPKQQAGNITARRGRSSQYKGVTKVTTRKQTKSGVHEYIGWMGQISDGPKHITAYFKNEVDAAMWYNEKAKEVFGDFASLNAIQEV